MKTKIDKDRHDGCLLDVIGDTGLISDGDWVESKDQDPDGDVRLVQLADVGVGEYLDKSSRFLTSAKAKALRCTFLLPGDLLVARMPDPIGRACIFPGDDRDCVTVVDVCIVRPDPKVIDSRWLMHAINSSSFRREIDKFVKGTTRQRISRTNLEGTSLRIPPIPEQRRIAEILDKAKALRTKRRVALAKLDTLAHSIFFDLLRQAGKGVQTISVEDGMAAIIDYRGKSPVKTESGVPLITARVVKGGELLEPTEYIAEEAYEAWMRRGLPQPGDVLFTTEAPLGEVAQLDGRKVALAQRLLVLRGKPSLFDNTFLKHALTSQEVRKQIFTRATGSTVQGIRQKELRKVMLPVPPLKMQRDFSRQVTALEVLKASHRASLVEMEALFASIQHRAFQGEL